MVDDLVRVIIECVPDRLNAIIAEIESVGEIETSYEDLVQALVPVSSLTSLSQDPDVSFIRQPYDCLLSSVTSEGVQLINADDWQNAGYTGTNVKLAILDLGFSGYTARQSEGELPASITTWWAPSIGGPGSEVHGTACAEIVYDVAPDAQIYLVNFNTDVELGNAVDWLIAQGVNVISASWGYPGGGPGDGTGPICDIVDKAYAAGITWVNAVGNLARQHWQGNFVDTDSDGIHEFAQGLEVNRISINNGDSIYAGLLWDDVWGGSSNDYALLLLDRDLYVVAGSDDSQDGDDIPLEGFSYIATYTGYYYLVIFTQETPAVVNFHLYSFYQDLQYQTASSSFWVPADSANVISVGAVPRNNPSTLETFSSRGPTKDGRIKPDLVAPDGVRTGTYGTSGFYGTSASTPHVVGAAALVKSRFPAYSLTQIQTYLEENTVDLGSTGKDNLYGSGRIYLESLFNMPPVLSEGNVNPASGTSTTDFTYSVKYLDSDNDAPSYITLSIDSGTPLNMTADSSNDGNYSNGEVYEYTTSGLTKGEHTFQFSSSDSKESATGDIGLYNGPLIFENNKWHIDNVENTTAWVGLGTSIAIDNENNIHIAYGDNSNDRIKYARWDGFSWNIMTVEQTDVKSSYGISLCLDREGNPYISYTVPSSYTNPSQALKCAH
jgi:hypothetical protein